MSLTKRLLYFVFIILVLTTSLACKDQTTERTTSMISSDTLSKTTTIISTEPNSSTESSQSNTLTSTAITTVVPTTEEATTTLSSSETTTEVLPIEFQEIVMVNETAVQHELLEFDLFADEANNQRIILCNPYDYTEIKVVFQFTSPSNKTLTQTAFWYRNYEKMDLIGAQIDANGYYTAGQEYIDWGDDSTSRYRVRINPDEVGTWAYVMNLVVKDQITQTLVGTFAVVESPETVSGFIQVDSINQRNFIFSESKDTYVPMGANFAWFHSTLGTYIYHNWFKHLNEHNGNFARVWLSNWSLSIHKFSYTNFDSRQNILARIDLLLNLAKANNVYIMLTLINHGQFSANTNPEWAENPYNQVNGGMLEYPIQFFYNDEAKKHYKNELMYIVSRYGYSENIFAWELFNEVDWVDGYSGLVVTRWHDEMAKFIKANDPYKHLISTSYKYTFGTPAFALDSIDFASFHSYAYGDVVYYEKLVSEMTSLWNLYQKPVFFGEIGIDWESGGNTYNSDFSGITIHQGLWGGMMSSAGGANQWWWDSWIENYNLWYRFQGASTYATYLELANREYELLQGNLGVSISGTNASIMGYLLNDAIYGYVYNNRWSYWNREPDAINDISITIPLANGNYTLTIMDTHTGVILEESNILIENNQWVIDGLSIVTDYAFIIK